MPRVTGVLGWEITTFRVQEGMNTELRKVIPVKFSPVALWAPPFKVSTSPDPPESFTPGGAIFFSQQSFCYRSP